MMMEEEDVQRETIRRRKDSHFFSVNWCSRHDFPTPISPGERRSKHRRSEVTARTLHWMVDGSKYYNTHEPQLLLLMEERVWTLN